MVTAKIRHHKHNELFKWATKIAERYMGKDDAEACGKRNSGESEVLVRIKPTRIISEKNKNLHGIDYDYLCCVIFS